VHEPASEMYKPASMYSTQNSLADPEPAKSPPPPHSSASEEIERGKGGGADQARQSIPNRYINLTARSQMAYIYTCLMHVQHMLFFFSTQVRKILSRNVVKCITFRRSKFFQGRGARGLSSCPKMGLF
jgi:hypothetical protein